ncbi:MAG: hypothetical protein WC781_03150 [Candidatus Pacearchaeota archaeon]|jgi:hypothetical protein
MKKNISKIKKYFLIGFFIIFLIFGCIFIFCRSNEDNWIKDDRGVWMKHGNPSETPDEIKEQQQAIINAFALYNNQKNSTQFYSQCLGNVGNYAVDIAHRPRIAEDNLKENQCENYLSEKVNHFIELDLDGNLIRIV